MSWFKCSTIECPLCARPCPRSWECNSEHNQQNSISLELIFSSPVCGLRANPTSVEIAFVVWAGEFRDLHVYFQGKAPCCFTCNPVHCPEAKLFRKVWGSPGFPPSPSGLGAPPGQEVYLFFFLNLSLTLQPQERSWPDIGTL